MKAITIVLCLLFLCMGAWAQNGYKGGTMFQLKPDFSFGEDWELNTKLESRQVLFEGLNKDPFNNVFHYDRTDLEMVLNNKISPLGAIGAGYLIRLEDGKFIHRLIQQFSIAEDAIGLGIAHRFRTDETIDKNESTKYRLRYRMSMEKALNGSEVDPGELYLEFSNEYLQSIQSKEYNLEIRALAAVGFNFNDNNKLETGLDYRIENLFSGANRQLLWLNIAWSLSF